MSKILKSFGRGEEAQYIEWVDSAEASGEMNVCENRAGIILKLARQELERLGHEVDESTEDCVGISIDGENYRVAAFAGVGIITLAITDKDDHVLVLDAYDDSASSLSEILGRIPPANAFPYSLIGKSIKIVDDTGCFHVNFIGRLPVVSIGGRHSFFEGEIVAGGCDDEGNYCHVPVQLILEEGFVSKAEGHD